MAIYIQKGKDLKLVHSLHPFLSHSLALGMVMDPKHMQPKDVRLCAWTGWGIGKGVTHITNDVSVFAVPSELKSGLHAELIQHFPNVDPFPLCYDTKKHVYGFGGFVRWVYFTNPSDTSCSHGVFGIDWSQGLPIAIGIAPSFDVIVSIAKRAVSHGIPPNAELALLNWRMIEPPEVTKWRHSLRLTTVEIWAHSAQNLFAPTGHLCMTCGQKTFLTDEQFCHQCGASFYTTKQEV